MRFLRSQHRRRAGRIARPAERLLAILALTLQLVLGGLLQAAHATNLLGAELNGLGALCLGDGGGPVAGPDQVPGPLPAALLDCPDCLAACGQTLVLTVPPQGGHAASLPRRGLTSRTASAGWPVRPARPSSDIATRGPPGAGA